jgi:hypothetical protein
MEKTSMGEMLKDPNNFNTALVPCKEVDCPRWDDGRYRFVPVGWWCPGVLQCREEIMISISEAMVRYGFL